MLLRIFTPVFMNKIGLQLIMISLSGFDVKNMSSSWYNWRLFLLPFWKSLRKICVIAFLIIIETSYWNHPARTKFNHYNKLILIFYFSLYYFKYFFRNLFHLNFLIYWYKVVHNLQLEYRLFPFICCIAIVYLISVVKGYKFD